MTPKAVVSALELKFGITGAPCQIRDAIESILLGNGMGPAEAAEQMDSLRKKVATEIVRRKNVSDEAGEIAILHLRGTEDEIVHGSSYVFAGDSEQIRTAKLNRTFADDIHTHIKGLTFNQFERFGRSVLRELGSTTAHVTPHSEDQGIDFYGDLSVGSLVGADPAILKLMHETKVILVGQAKHYPTSAIGPAIVRELVGALSLSRTYTYSKDNLDLLNDVQLRPFSPVLALLFSTGNFTRGARHLAKRAGLIAFSGWQLAVFLADKGVGIASDNGARSFDPATFEQWLE
jgi:hypothetical protein